MSRRRVIGASAIVLGVILATLSPIPTTPASAGPGDNFDLSKTDSVNGEALIGELVTYTLTASGTQSSGADLYNLSFRDVLPVGVAFVSADPAPTGVLDDVPTVGQTTLVWENVADLPTNSRASISYVVDTNPDFSPVTGGSGTAPVGATVSNSAEAVGSLDAFRIPDWDEATGLFTGDFDGQASASNDVDIIPFRVTKAGPGELLRGVHDTGFGGRSGSSGATYTIEVENNPDYATEDVTLVDVLSPVLEYLGCDDYYSGSDDSSTDVPFRESAAAADEEWAGSGPMATGSGPCLAPTSVDTVDAGLGGGLANTVVEWDIGDLGPGSTSTVTYRAGIPMRANTTTWTTVGGAPTAASLAQGRNLDNNAGPSTNELDRVLNPDPELLTDGASSGSNTATADGTYTPTATNHSNNDVLPVEGEDIVIDKSMSGVLEHGTTATASLTVTTGEYRDFTDLVVRDLLPSALCYTGTYGVDTTPGGSDWASSDCPGAGSGTGTATSVRELTGGGPYDTGRFEILWDQTAVPGLADLDSDETLTIDYSAVVRTNYRDGLVALPGEPVLAGDSVVNQVEVSGPDFVVAAHTNDNGADDELDGGVDGDTASADLTNTLPSIDKRVGAKVGPLANGAGAGASTCSSSYGTISWQDTVATGFGPGDVVCFELGASFPSLIEYETVTIQDLLPPGYSYIPGSEAAVGVDDMGAIGFDETSLRWSPGTVDNTGREFQRVIAALVGDPDQGSALDINENLQKMTHNNNGGLVYQYRDGVPAEWTEPEVRLAKGVDNVNAGPSNGPDQDGSLTGGSTAVSVVAGDVVEFRLDVWNVGNTDALATEVQDHLPAAFDCSDVSTISDGGACSGGVISWSGLTVAASTGGGDLTPDDETNAPVSLRYDLTVPADIDPAQAWTNNAGVAVYQASTNTAGTYNYYPTDNIDPANATLENTDAADDAAYLESPAPTVSKNQQTGIDESGNAANATPADTDDQATIGEIIQYQISVTIPEGTTVYDAEIRDSLPAGLVWFTGNGLFNGTVSNLQPTVAGTAGLTGGSVAHTAGTVTYELPDPWVNAAGSGDDTVTITFYAQVEDTVANTADPAASNFANRGRFDWDDATGNDRPDSVSPVVDTAVVEPNPAIVKDHTSPSGTDVLPGQTVTYRITVSNATTANNVSAAHDVTVVDTVPLGLTPLGTGGTPVSGNGDLVPTSGVSPAGLFDGTWSETNRTITWTPSDWSALDVIDPDGTVQLTYDVEVDDPAVASSVLTNTADLTAYSLDQNLNPTEDPNEGDARTYTDSDDHTVDAPQATIDKDVEPFNPGDPGDDLAALTVGEPVDYQVDVTLPSGTVAYDTTLFDDLPAQLSFDEFGTIGVGTECEMFDAASGSSTGLPLPAVDVETFNPVNGDSGLAAWFLGDLYANGDCTISVVYTTHVDDSAVDGGTVTNDSVLVWNDADQVAGGSPVALPAGYDDPDSASWSTDSGPASESFTITEPSLDIDKDVTTTTGAALVDPSCDTTAGNHNAGSDDADGTPGDGCDTSAGSDLRFTLIVTSTGTGAAHDITIVDTVPDGLTPLTSPGGSPVTTTGQTVTGDSGSAGTWDETAHTIAWTMAGPLATSATASVDYDARVDASDDLGRGQDLANVADIETYYGIAAADRSQIVTDNPANDDIVIYGNDPSATRGTVAPDTVTVEVHFPDLSVNKSATSGQDPTDARLDQPFSWTITVANDDAVAPAFNVDVTDVLPDGWTYDPGSASVTTPHNGGPVAVEPTCTADTGSCGQASVLNIETLSWTDLISGPSEPLDPGATITITLTATPQSAALTPDQTTGESFTGYSGGSGFAHTNNVVTSGEDATGSTTCCDLDGPGPLPPEGYSATGDDDVFIARSDIEVDKAVSPLEDDANADNGPYWFGSYVNYTITVDNLGPDDATNVTVADVLDAAQLEFDAVLSADQGTFDDTSNVWDVGTVADGASIELVLRTRLIGLGAVTNTAQAESSDQYDSDSTPGNDLAGEDDQDSVSITVVPTSLGDSVWLDLDADGVQDTGEPGIPDVKVDLVWTDPDGTPRSYTTTTGGDGAYGVPTAVGLPADTDIAVTIDVANSPNLIGLAPSFDRDGTTSAHTSTDQITTTDSTLPGGELADLDFDYGYTPDGAQSVGNRLWWDQDDSADATDGLSEPRIPAVDITATWAGWDGTFGTGDDLDFVTATDPAGTYVFDAIPPGDFRVTVDDTQLPVGLTSPTYDLDGTGSAHTVAVTVDPGEDQLDVDFSYTGVGSIGDTVWFDHDGDGAIDPGEPGLGGVTVTLDWAGGDGVLGDDPGTAGIDESADDVSLTTVTAHDGTYEFENLPEGDYIVIVDDSTIPGGLTPTYDDDTTSTPHTSAVTLTAGVPVDQDQDFGYRGTGSIGDTVFFDVDGTELDGAPDAGDSGLGSIDVTVTWGGADGFLGDDPGTTTIDESADDFSYTDTTDTSGDYLVAYLPFGDYSISIDDADLPAGLDTATFDDDGIGTPHTSTTTLDFANPDDTDQDFAYTGDASGVVGDTIWYDQNGDGVEDPGEVGFSGVTVTLVWFGPDGSLGGGDDVTQTTTTGPSGSYLFDNLPHGEFNVVVDDTTLPAGLSPTFDGDGTGSAHESRLTLDAASPSNRNQDFGYTGVGSLGDTVWYDTDNSGTAGPDTGEPGLADVELTIVWTNPQGSDVIHTVTTDQYGNYLLPDLPHGDYTITVDDTTLPPGTTPTFDDDGVGTAHSSIVTLDGANTDDLGQDFSYTGVGSLGDTVWFDQNDDGAPDPAGSGIFDDQDQPLAGVDVAVTWGGPDGFVGDDPGTPVVDESADDVIHRTTTDANGEWLVDDLPYGPYRVDVDPLSLPPGLTVATFDADGTTTADSSIVTLDAGTPDNLDQDFSYIGSGSVGDLVWFDLDGDGNLDSDEVGLAGVAMAITYTGPSGTPISETIMTGLDGSYLFDGLPLGTTLTITVDDTTLPPGFAPTHDADGVVTPHLSIVTLSAAEPDNRDQDFGYNGSGSIGDTVFFDRDATEVDGVPDLADVGIPNVDVTITWTNPTGGPDLVTTVTTVTDGSYGLTGLPPGDYTVRIDDTTLPSGMTPTFDADGTGSSHVSSTTLDASNPDDLELDFSYTGTGSIGNMVWHDEDGDGVLDADEDPLAAITVLVSYTDPNTGLTFTDSTTTDTVGRYRFDDLPAGDYTVSVAAGTLPQGWIPTFDHDGIQSPGETDVDLGDGEDRADVDFGYRPEADLATTKTHEGPFVIGLESTWNVTVSNQGAAAAASPVTVTDELPNGISYVDASGDDWVCSAAGRLVTCTYVDGSGAPVDMAPYAESTLELTVTVDGYPAATVTNTATIDSGTVDPNPENNGDDDTVDLRLSILDIDKGLDGDIESGEQATYVITVTNFGPSATSGDVTVSDDLPVGLTFVDATTESAGAACSETTGTVTCTNSAVLEPGAVWIIELTVDVTATAGTRIVNNVTVAGGNRSGDSEIPQSVLDDIYDELGDSDSGLASQLGIALDARPDDSGAADATVEIASSGILAFTGATTRRLAQWAGMLLIAGMLLMATSRRRRNADA